MNTILPSVASSPNAACQARLCGQRDVRLDADTCRQRAPCLYTCLLFAQRPGPARAGIREVPTSLAILFFFIIWECTDSCLIWKVKNSQTARKDWLIWSFTTYLKCIELQTIPARVYCVSQKIHVTHAVQLTMLGIFLLYWYTHILGFFTPVRRR